MFTTYCSEGFSFIQYGIQNEESDLRAHVSGCNKSVYVFETINGIRAINDNCESRQFAKQPGIDRPTGEGWLVKISWIDGIKKIECPDWTGWNDGKPYSLKDRGKLACECVKFLINSGRFPMLLESKEMENINCQIKGIDLVITSNRKKIQVKCDWIAGQTGNLFLQFAEINPMGIY